MTGQVVQIGEIIGTSKVCSQYFRLTCQTLDSLLGKLNRLEQAQPYLDEPEINVMGIMFLDQLYKQYCTISILLMREDCGKE